MSCICHLKAMKINKSKVFSSLLHNQLPREGQPKFHAIIRFIIALYYFQIMQKP